MLRDLREKHNWSQWDLAVMTTWIDAAGKTRMIRPEQISKYESGSLQPSRQNLSLLARALGVTQELLSPAPPAAPLGGASV
jgi:transcriptional regulator with XRE-family HTH domain